MERLDEDAAQPMLLDMPEARPAAGATAAERVASKPKPKPASTEPDGSAVPTALVDAAVTVATPPPFSALPDAIAGVVLIDPRVIAVDPVNVHFGVPFRPEAHGELIESMRRFGNTVPVRLRVVPGGAAPLCLSGSRRLGAALHIQQGDPDFRLRAIVADGMTDGEAFTIAEADNAGRTGVAPMQQARHWAATLENVYQGDRQAFIAATGRTASVVSRTLALLALPDYVTAACSDPEALTPYFAEQLAPRLGDVAEEPAIRARAEALIASGRRLPGAALVRTLLADVPEARPAARSIWSSEDGSRGISFRSTRNGGRIDVAGVAFTPAERRALLKELAALLGSLSAQNGKAKPAVAQPKGKQA